MRLWSCLLYLLVFVNKRAYTLQDMGWQRFSINGQIINILGFARHTISVAIVQLCPLQGGCNHTLYEMNGHGRVPLKLYF